MIEQYEKGWNLRFINLLKDFEPDRHCSEAASNDLMRLISSYPNQEHKMLTFVNNTVIGNLFFNFISDYLLRQDLIRYKCLRITSDWGFDSLEEQYYDNDVIFIDNIEFKLMNKTQMENLITFIDYHLNKTNLIILNLADENDLNEFAPKILKSMVNYGSYNIRLKE